MNKKQSITNIHQQPPQQLGTTQALRTSAGKSTCGGLVSHRWGCTMSQGNSVGTLSPTWTTPSSETWTAV